MGWLWVPAALAAIFICLWHIRVRAEAELREHGAGATVGLRLAGFIPTGQWKLTVDPAEDAPLTLSYHVMGVRILRVPLRGAARPRIPARRVPPRRISLSPAAYGRIGRAFRPVSLSLTLRDLFLPLDSLCLWAGSEKIAKAILGAWGIGFAVKLGKDADEILKIEACFIMNLVRLSTIVFSNLRKKV